MSSFENGYQVFQRKETMKGLILIHKEINGNMENTNALQIVLRHLKGKSCYSVPKLPLLNKAS